MSETKVPAIDAGEEVARAIGELNATVQQSAKAVAETGIDQEEAKGWLTTIFKALLAALK